MGTADEFMRAKVGVEPWDQRKDHPCYTCAHPLWMHSSVRRDKCIKMDCTCPKFQHDEFDAILEALI
jgi:hypothetical protein